MRVEVEMRKVYFVKVGDKRKRFATEAAAYYKLCAALLGAKYLSALRAVELGESGEAPVPDVGDFPASPTASERHRAARARVLFVQSHGASYEGPRHDEFVIARWQDYVRRVARKMRAMDRCNTAARTAADGEGA